MSVVWGVVTLLGASFLFIVLRGAPFVPTRSRDIGGLFSLHRFKPGDVLVDLGSGDGRILKIAASRGIQSVGYELNPFLVWYSRLRLRRYRNLTTVRLTDFWIVALPEKTAVVFVFLASPFMKKLDRKLSDEAKRLGHDILLVSYGVTMPEKRSEATSVGFTAYRYRPQ